MDADHAPLEKVLQGDAVMGGALQSWVEGYCFHAGLNQSEAAHVVAMLRDAGSQAEDEAIAAEASAMLCEGGCGKTLPGNAPGRNVCHACHAEETFGEGKVLTAALAGSLACASADANVEQGLPPHANAIELAREICQEAEVPHLFSSCAISKRNWATAMVAANKCLEA